MMRMILLASAACCLVAGGLPAAEGDSDLRPLSLVVMDPLAAPLSCPCVKGYAQRKYEALAKHLEESLGRDVRLTFAESLKLALHGDAKGRADLVIGKHSVVLADAEALGRSLTALASLTGKDGLTTQQGLIVVPAADPAKTVSDLDGYRVLFGPADSDEKHRAAMQLLRAAGVDWQRPLETSQACSDGATKILGFGQEIRAAAVISSYAQPLLQGCGTINKGDLRVVGETRPVPFVTAFVGSDLSEDQRHEIESALLDVGAKPQLCQALETLVGFLPYGPPEQTLGGQQDAVPAPPRPELPPAEPANQTAAKKK